MNQKRFDLIIAGAGAAGLSLLWRILESDILKDQTVLLIDQSFQIKNDKTWCFWEKLDLPNPDLIHHSWKEIAVQLKENTYSDTLQNYQYNLLRSSDLQSFILKKAEKYSNVTFLETNILDFSSEEETGQVHTSEGIFAAKRVFQSVKQPPNFQNLEVDISLIQHFLGWEIETKRDLFNPNVATIMDFDVPQKNGNTFMYLLPFSSQKALVEYTVFSKKVLEKNEYKKQIADYLETNYQIKKSEYSIAREEFGTIPMEDRKYPPWYCNNVLNIGRMAGLPKPSTGYTFSRIQKHSSKIVEALEKGNELPSEPLSPYRFRVYDIMMLYLFEQEPHHSLEVFEKLFSNYGFDLVLQFLAEETTPFQELRILSGMPYHPFFRSIYKMKHRIFGNA